MCSSGQVPGRVAVVWSPRELAEAEPGPEVAVALLLLDPAGLSADDRLWVVQAWERHTAWAMAQGFRAVAAFTGPADVGPAGADAGDGVEGGGDWCREELAAGLRLGRGAAQARIDTARVLTGVLPGTLGLLGSGRISGRHAQVVAEGCAGLSGQQAAVVEARVLPKAPGLTAAELRVRVRRAVAAADPAGFEVAHAAAAARRCVRWWPEPDGMATLAVTAPAAGIRALYGAVDTLARAADADPKAGTDPSAGGAAGTRASAAGSDRTAGSDLRGIDARRADVLLALANTALGAAAERAGVGEGLSQGRRRVAVQVVMDTATLLGLAEHPAELVGYGPIPASVARALAADGTWTRLVADPVTGHLLDYGNATYRPPAALREYLIARDRACQFPGCTHPAHRAELDHLTPHPAGATSATNMTALCKRHHQAKTRHDWHPTRGPDGDLTWTSPLGRQYTVPATNHWPNTS